jgi:4-hydroxythreonine-4-phosphate dehydrogenase
MSARKVLAVSLGCPAGVGPEVAVLGAAAASAAGRAVVLVGDRSAIERAARLRRAEIRLVDVATRSQMLALSNGEVGVYLGSEALGGTESPGKPDEAAGRAQLAWIDGGCDLVRAGTADALVTGPVSKLAIAISGAPGAQDFLGHTEHLARRLDAREVVMAFSSNELATALVTTHLALRDVPQAITAAAVATSTYWLARLLIARGIAPPRVAVAALNPHAGEGGLLGDEETTQIQPGLLAAVERLKAEGLAAEVTGALGAETAFRRSVGPQRSFDGVVAMYHDQATIPMKLLGFGEATNVTLGLPIVRTSVDHGTGYDIAWQGKADPRGMIEALELAAVLSSAAPPIVTASASRRES